MGAGRLFNSKLDNGHVLIFHDADKANGYMSNWYMASFKDYGGREYCCVEQYLMYQKAKYFNDRISMHMIMATKDPGVMKAIGRRVRGYTDDWENMRGLVLSTGLLLKFGQNWHLARRLIKTGDKILCEGTATDMVYANGLTRYDKDRFDPQKWPGKNLLGYALMDIRKYLKNTMH